MSDCKTRPLGGTESSWARAVPGGTGVTVIALLISHPPQISVLQTALRTLQTHHPILRSKLITDAPAPFFSIPDSPLLQIGTVDLPTTSALLAPASSNVSPLHRLLEHELNLNTPWADHAPAEPPDVFFATLYEIPDSKVVFALRLHTSVCDRTAAVALMRELMVLMREREKGADWGADEAGLPVEEMIPKGKGDKPFWARGLDLAGYSLNSFRQAQLDFEDVSPSRRSEVVRLEMSEEETSRLLAVRLMGGPFFFVADYYCMRWLYSSWHGFLNS
ncbi:hypothetical protein ACLOJK_005837 [Asimina triloba]